MTDKGFDFPVDEYRILFVEPDTYTVNYTSKMFSRMRAEKHADYLTRIGKLSIEVVRIVS